MFEKISFLVPTRGRVEQLKRLLYSYGQTTRCAPEASELVFRVDDDDTLTVQFLERLGHRMLIGPRLKGYESLPHFFNELWQEATGDVFMLGNDDVEFVTEGWAPKILKVANQFPDGVFDIGVKTHNEDHYPLSTVSRRVVERLGFLFAPNIFWGDIFLRDVMGRFSRNVKLPEVEIQHLWAGFAPDQIFLEGEQARRSNWMTHHVSAVDAAEAKLRGLIT